MLLKAKIGSSKQSRTAFHALREHNPFLLDDGAILNSGTDSDLKTAALVSSTKPNSLSVREG